jgi:hypothetical protein
MGRDLNSRPPVCETGIITRLDHPSKTSRNDPLPLLYLLSPYHEQDELHIQYNITNFLLHVGKSAPYPLRSLHYILEYSFSDRLLTCLFLAPSRLTWLMQFLGLETSLYHILLVPILYHFWLALELT